MKYFDVPVTVVAQGATLEEAQLNVYKFMPELREEHTKKDYKIDSWFVNDVDNNALDFMAGW